MLKKAFEDSKFAIAKKSCLRTAQSVAELSGRQIFKTTSINPIYKSSNMKSETKLYHDPPV